jgi:hypothetical protein
LWPQILEFPQTKHSSGVLKDVSFNMHLHMWFQHDSAPKIILNWSKTQSSSFLPRIFIQIESAESSLTVIVVTALVKAEERGGQGHAYASLLFT